MGTEDYGNLGDHQIAVSEKEWIRCTFGDEYIVREVPARKYWEWIPYIRKYMNKSDIILGHGGGNLGNQYLPSENIRRDFVRSFPQNPIVIMPQTVFFLDDEQGKKELENSQDVYNNHPRLLLYTREKQSYEFAKKNFTCQVRLVPDIVMFSDYSDYHENRCNTLLCLRGDIESVLNKEEKEKIYQILGQYGSIERIDTQKDFYIDIEDREPYLEEFKHSIASAKIVVTDRLHGMIFCAITKTPCVVMENYNYKIEGCYDWLRNLPYIEYIHSLDDLETAIGKVMRADNSCFDNQKLQEYFVEMGCEVKKYLGISDQ